jgi:outer membrane immunogenic protein
MKKFLVMAAAFGLLALPAMAADMAPAPAPYYKAPIVVPVYNWTGFYIGGNVGGAWGNFDPTTSTVFSPVGYFAASSVLAINAAGIQSSKPSGVTGGFEAGYNWQSSNYVFGVEGDIEALSLSNSVSSGAVYPCCAPTAFTVTSNVSTTWLATVRGRLGYAVNNWLFFVTGGVAFTDLRGNFAFSDTFANAAESASFSDTKTGYTIGGGVEAGLWGNWSVKGEYLYANFGTLSATSTNLAAFTPVIAFPTNPFTHSFDLKANIARVALNYRF